MGRPLASHYLLFCRSHCEPKCYLSIPIIMNGLLWPIVHSYVTKEWKSSAAGVQKKDTELNIFLFPSILFSLSVYYTFNKDVFMSFYLHKYKKRIYIYRKRQKKLIWNKTNVNTTKSENYSSSALILFISFWKRIFFVGGYVSLLQKCFVLSAPRKDLTSAGKKQTNKSRYNKNKTGERKRKGKRRLVAVE